MTQNFRLEWLVPYQPGKLFARGYDIQGREIVRTHCRTTQAPAKIALRPLLLNHPSEVDDVVVVSVEIQDAEGEISP